MDIRSFQETDINFSFPASTRLVSRNQNRFAPELASPQALIPVELTVLSLASAAKTYSPYHFRFWAAFGSRWWCAPHDSQSHSRSSSLILALIAPQQEQRFVLGKKRSATITLPPDHSALYLHSRPNSAQPLSAIAFARQWFFNIPTTFKSSSTSTGLVFT